MAEHNITACPHCGQRIPASPATDVCPGCARPLVPSPDELRKRIARLSRQHAGAGKRLGLLQKEYGDLHQQLQRLADTREADREGARLQWESALEEERHLRTQAEAVAAELRIVRAGDMEQYLRDHQPEAPSADEWKRLQQLADAALPLEARIRELERHNTALQAKLNESERTLLDAAGMVEQVSELRAELDRLGTRYLHAREEASRLLNEKLDLRAELDTLAEQLREQATREQPFTGTRVEQAREQIRNALRRHASRPEPPTDPRGTS